jgi:hypothetical protein
MRKPNSTLTLMAQAVSAGRKARAAKTQSLRAFYARKAQSFLSAAAKSTDAVEAIRIISASNQKAEATVAASAKRRRAIRAELDDVVVDDLDLTADEIVDVDDPLMADDDSDDDKSDEKKDADEVDSSVAGVLSRARKLRARRLPSARRR